jgi:aminoglycoside phosphotransferase (APT) family kinase protein
VFTARHQACRRRANRHLARPPPGGGTVPQWASLAIELVESAGCDNTIFRLGPDLAVRLPRRRVSAEHVRNEHRWLPLMAPDLPLAVPVPVGHGMPGEGYPWYWTVCPWLNGELAALTPVADLGRAATSLGRFVAASQAMDPAGGLVHEFRGVSLAAHDHNAKAAALASRHGPASRSGFTATFIQPTCSLGTRNSAPSRLDVPFR